MMPADCPEEIMPTDCPYLMKIVYLQSQEVQQNPPSNRHKPIHIIVNLLRNKEKILKEAREKCFMKFRVTTKILVAKFTLKAIEVRSQ